MPLSAPVPADLVLAKTETNSGDEQVAAAGTMLEQALRVIVTRDDLPVRNVMVIWSTPEGSVSPAASTTDAAGGVGMSGTVTVVPRETSPAALAKRRIQRKVRIRDSG